MTDAVPCVKISHIYSLMLLMLSVEGNYDCFIVFSIYFSSFLIYETMKALFQILWFNVLNGLVTMCNTNEIIKLTFEQ